MISLETLRGTINDAADPNDCEDVAIRSFLVAELESVLTMYRHAEVSPCAHMQQKKAARSPRNRRRTRETARRTSVLSADTSHMTARTVCSRGPLSPPAPSSSPNRCFIPAALRWS